MSEFKAGDKVRVKHDLLKSLYISGEEFKDIAVTPTMLSAATGEQTIRIVGTKIVSLENIPWAYLPEWLEPVEEPSDLTKLDKHYKDLSIEEKVGLFEAGLRGEVIEWYSTTEECWLVLLASIDTAYGHKLKYRVQPKPSANDLEKKAIMDQMEELKQRLDKLETK